MIFQDRRDGGRRLALMLEHLRPQSPLVLGLPRGGVVVAAEVARALQAPLDVWVVRKIGAPFQPELALGAIAEGGGRYLNQELIEDVGATPADLERTIRRETQELERRVSLYRLGRPRPDARGRTVIVVDDGLATGATARAALRALRGCDPARLVLAVPVGAPQTVAALGAEADEVVCLEAPPHLGAVGSFYVDFGQTSDEEVLALLGSPAAPSVVAARRPGSAGG